MVKATLDSNDRQFLDRLHRLEAGTVQEICAEIGVTATAVRQRLNRLQGLGFVTRETVRCGRGRPHHAYRITDAGMRELGDNYADLAMILWSEVRNIEPIEVRSRVLESVQAAFVDRYSRLVQGKSLHDRFDQLRAALVERGFDVEVDNSGPLPILRENNCPFLEMASHDPAICEMEREVFQRVLGVDVELTQCCLDGSHCCEFQPVGAAS
jgi:predicted ArsR family transcriptional regulator